MNVQAVSDLHLEFLNEDQMHKLADNIAMFNFDVLIIAGDLSPSLDSINEFFFHIAAVGNHKDIIFVPGNHDYYGTNTIDRDTELYAIEEAIRTEFDINLHVLNQKRITISGVSFSGCTLWSPALDHTATKIADMNQIKNYPEIVSLAYEHREFLRKFPADVMITHHLPGSHVVVDDPNNDPDLDQYFYNEIFDENYCPYPDCIKYWIFGHTHTPSIQQHNNIRYICNPHGYKEAHEKFDLRRSFSI